MGRYLIRVECPEERFIEWSTVVDAPVTYGMTEDELRAWHRREYGEYRFAEIEGRIQRCRERGTSAYHIPSLEAVITGNRAGPDETEATLEEIVAKYGHPPRGD